MASIFFEILDTSTIKSLSGSGLGFYGSTFGASVSTTSYQDSTYLTDENGESNFGSARNVKFLNPSGAIAGTNKETGCLTAINGTEATLLIHFAHTSNVKVQNAQLRIYDRTSIDNAAVGVVTKVAEIVNYAGATEFGGVNGWQNNGGPDVDNAYMVHGYGDALWWGSPWPAIHTYAGDATSTRPYYINSVGVKFENFTDYQYERGTGNPQLQDAVSYPGYETVGGTGIIVPLLDSPGTYGSGLWKAIQNDHLRPKYIQYISNLHQTKYGTATAYSSANLTHLSGSFGGTGYDTRHTWRVALSAKPLNIGSKKQYGLYVSLEYL
jgi:hypothetical protein